LNLSFSHLRWDSSSFTEAQALAAYKDVHPVLNNTDPMSKEINHNLVDLFAEIFLKMYSQDMDKHVV